MVCAHVITTVPPSQLISVFLSSFKSQRGYFVVLWVIHRFLGKKFLKKMSHFRINVQGLCIVIASSKKINISVQNPQRLI